MCIFSDDPGCSGLIKSYGEYSEAELALMKSFISPDSVVVDAGAHIGAFTIPLARCCKKVYAFEPQAEVVDVLRENLEMNGITNVEVIPMALSSVEQTLYYDLSHANWKDSLGSVQMEKDAFEGASSVATKTLDSFGLEPDFIKADVEGMELHVLCGAQKTIARSKPYMMIERSFQKETYDQVMAILNYVWLHLDLPLFMPTNWKGNKVDAFPSTVHQLVLAYPYHV